MRGPGREAQGRLAFGTGPARLIDLRAGTRAPGDTILKFPNSHKYHNTKSEKNIGGTAPSLNSAAQIARAIVF